jgi:hypothetical protein
MLAPPETEWECAECPPDENRWPVSSFRDSGNAFKQKKRCNDCFAKRYGRRRTTACAGGCGRRVQTRKEAGMCRACQGWKSAGSPLQREAA